MSQAVSAPKANLFLENLSHLNQNRYVKILTSPIVTIPVIAAINVLLFNSIIKPTPFLNFTLEGNLSTVFKFAAKPLEWGQAATLFLPYVFNPRITNCLMNANPKHCDKVSLVIGHAIVGLYEEFVFRTLIQERLLKKMAQLLPGKLKNVFEHQIARIALTSLLFALLHGRNHSGPGKLSHSFFRSLLWGYLAEKSGSFLPAAYAHTCSNLVSRYIETRK